MALSKTVREECYPLAVFCISLALLFHISLISYDLVGWDIHLEYYLFKIVELSGFWDPQADIVGSNSMLSVTIIPVVYSTLLNIDYTAIYKWVDVTIYAFVPVGLYQIYKRQHNYKIAFIAVFFFVSVSKFYFSMPGLPRQEIASLFLILILLLLVDKQQSIMIRNSLFIIFGCGLIFSHYATAYIAIGLLLASLVLRVIIPIDKKSVQSPVKITSIGVLIITIYFWYAYTSNSLLIEVPVKLGHHVIESLHFDFLSMSSREGAKFIYSEAPGSLEILKKYFHMSTQFFIVIGVLISLLNIKRFKWNKDMYFLSLSAFSLLMMSVVLPQFNAGFNFSRLYHISLIFLAPFCIVGSEYSINIGLQLSNKIFGVFKHSSSQIMGFIQNSTIWKRIRNSNLRSVNVCHTLLTSFFVIFFLLNANVPNALLHQYSSSVAFPSDSISQQELSISPFDLIYTYICDRSGASWLSVHKSSDFKVVSDLLQVNKFYEVA